MRKPRFSLAAGFWVLTVCAIAFGWYADRSTLVAENQKLAGEKALLEIVLQAMRRETSN